MNCRKKIRQCLLIIISLFLFRIAYPADTISADIQKQLDMDMTLIPMGKGALFVPYILDSQREPTYTIFKENEYVTDAEPGKRVPLNPGKYTIYVGSGPLDLRSKMDVSIDLERVTAVSPVWSALVINVYDENSNALRESYQIISEETKLTIGFGVGADETLGEKAQIWILKPGLYRLMKKGESPDSFRNFVTVRTTENKASAAVLYFDDKTRQVLGGGEVSGEKGGYVIKNWVFKAVLSGVFSFTNQGYFDSDQKAVNSLSLGSSFNGSIIFDKNNYLFTNKMEIYESFLMQENRKILNNRDLFKFDSLFMYRFVKWMGPYVSTRLKSRLFWSYQDFSRIGDDVDLVAVERDGTRNILDKSRLTVLTKSFSPTTVQEGVGINMEYRHGNIFYIAGRAGYGFKQDIAPYYYDDSSEAYSVSYRDFAIRIKEIKRVTPFQQTNGPEFSLYFSVMPFSFIELKEDFISLLPINNYKQTYFSSESTVSVWISSFASIQYYFYLERQPSLSTNISSYHALTVQLFLKLL